MNRIFGWDTLLRPLIGGMLVFFGLLCGIFGGAGTVAAARAGDWPTTEGEVVGIVVNAEAREVIRHDDYGTKGRAWTETVETPVYRYTVGGVERKSDRQGFFPPLRQPPVLDVGDPVTVYYDPEDPSSAVLHKGSSDAILVLVAGVVLLAAGVLLLRRPRPARES